MHHRPMGDIVSHVEAGVPFSIVTLFQAWALPISPEAGWRRGGGFHRAPYYPRRYGGFYGDGGFYRAPYYPRYSGAYSGGYDGWCGGYGNYGGYGGYGGYANYGGYDGYGYDGYGW